MQLINESGASAQQLVALDSEGFETLLVLVKASFDLARLREGLPDFASLHDKLELADVYRQDPASSSLLQFSEAAIHKLAADVLLVGHARPLGRDQKWGEVALECGSIRKRAVVSGPRLWKRGALGGAVPGEPGPMEPVPLIWEETFGGVDASYDPPRRFEDNPAGNGYRPSSTAELRGQPAPRLEHPDFPQGAAGSKGHAIGFGALAPFWAERARHGGTYDDAWKRSRMPLLPKDFSPRFHQVAPPDQVLEGYVRGGERVRLKGVTPGGLLECAVPRWKPELTVALGDEVQPLECRCDTLVFDTDRMTMSLTFRASLRIHGRLDELQWVLVSEADPRG